MPLTFDPAQRPHGSNSIGDAISSFLGGVRDASSPLGRAEGEAHPFQIAPSGFPTHHTVNSPVDLAKAVGMTTPDIMAAICAAESGCVIHGPDGAGAKGLWQIQWNVWSGKMAHMGLTNPYDAMQNAHMARYIQRTSGMRAWSTYKPPYKYKHFLNAQGKYIGPMLSQGVDTAGGRTAPGPNLDPVAPMMGLANSVGSFLKEVMSGKFWLEIAKVIGGGLLLLVGLYLLAKQTSAGKSAIKSGKKVAAVAAL